MESTGEWRREFSKMNYVKTATELIIRKQGRRNHSRRGQRENNRRDDIRDSTDCWCCNVLTVTCHRLAHLIQRAHLHIHKYPLCHVSCTSFAPVPNFVQSRSFWLHSGLPSLMKLSVTLGPWLQSIIIVLLFLVFSIFVNYRLHCFDCNNSPILQSRKEYSATDHSCHCSFSRPSNFILLYFPFEQRRAMRTAPQKLRNRTNANQANLIQSSPRTRVNRYIGRLIEARQTESDTADLNFLTLMYKCSEREQRVSAQDLWRLCAFRCNCLNKHNNACHKQWHPFSFFLCHMLKL